MTTNLDEIRIQSKILSLAVPIESDNKFGIFVQHPFTSSLAAVDFKTHDFVDLTDDKQKYDWLENLGNFIMEQDLLHIYMMLNTPWKLTWLKFCKKYMSEKDFAEFFADAWIASGNPNGDVNVDISTLISWFRTADKKHLMVKEDYKHWEEIPEKITLYRGVGKDRNPYGLSYTASKKTADFFQNRFYKNEGFMLTIEVDKKDILAYMNTRGEDEYVVDTSRYKKQIEKGIF